MPGHVGRSESRGERNPPLLRIHHVLGLDDGDFTRINVGERLQRRLYRGSTRVPSNRGTCLPVQRDRKRPAVEHGHTGAEAHSLHFIRHTAVVAIASVGAGGLLSSASIFLSTENKVCLRRSPPKGPPEKGDLREPWFSPFRSLPHPDQRLYHDLMGKSMSPDPFLRSFGGRKGLRRGKDVVCRVHVHIVTQTYSRGQLSRTATSQ